MKARNSVRTAPRAGPVIDLAIDEIGARGDGIARHEGLRIFVPFTVPGERVRAELGHPTAEGVPARLVEIVEPGRGRRKAPCAHFSNPDLCGGCTLQQLDPAVYAEWKRDQVRAALRRQGLDAAVVEPVRLAEPGSRRRATFAVQKRANRVILGFNERQSHRIVDLQDCPVLDPAITAVLPQLRLALALVLEQGGAADVSVTLLEGGLDVLLFHDRPLTLAAREALANFAHANDVARLSWRNRKGGWTEPLAWRREVAALFGGVPVPVAPGAFLQATASAERALVDAVLDGVGPAQRVVDLFAGSGTFSFPLAASGRRVHAVEADGEGVAALTAAAGRSRLQMTAERRDLFRDPLSSADLAAYDAAVLDPPRAGARQQAEMLAQSRLDTVVAVSCNPATFARDARSLTQGGYRLEWVLPVDQFLWSAHIELVGNFKRLK
jgi:23S rRNA (uracil1939-C5)-methyltransferase